MVLTRRVSWPRASLSNSASVLLAACMLTWLRVYVRRLVGGTHVAAV
jgi:hypothetical protein